MSPEQAKLLLQCASKLVKKYGAIAIATKTISSGDTRNVNDGGKSVELLEAGKDFELHYSDDGLCRYYYSPEATTNMLATASGLQNIEAETITTPYGSVGDCEFVVAIAR